MQTILSLLYIVSGFYSIYIIFEIISLLFKKKQYSEIFAVMVKKSYASAILIIALISAPLDFYFVYSNSIPEGNYSINTVLRFDDDPMKYAIDTDIHYYKDIYYEDEIEEPDYLRKGSSFPNAVINRTFILDDLNFNNYEIENLPETIQSGQIYDIRVYMPINKQRKNSEYEWFQANLEIPVLTNDTLEITSGDQLRSISMMGYVEHIGIFLSALIGILFCFPRTGRGNQF